MKRTALLLPLLFCIALTACTAKTGPGILPQTAPVITEPPSVPENTVAVTPYEMEGTGAKELLYDDRWKFYIEEYEPETASGDLYGTSALLCQDLTTGDVQVVKHLEYGSWHAYWDTVNLFHFTDVLGCDGIIFEHESGAAWLDFDFFAVTDAGPEWMTTCYNTIYTADLDGDGQLELLSNYHLMGYLDLSWVEPDGTRRTCSLNETAQDYLGMPNWVSLLVQEGSGEVQAQWAVKPDGQSFETRMLELVSLWKWEKART